MAKRYIRLNWQNKPSVATPINATNLNKMDKGIDDCDNAIEDIYAKRVNNTITTNEDTFLAGPVGKNLQDQITTINNNLANVNFVNLGHSPNLDDIGDTGKIVVANFTNNNGQNVIISYYYLISGNKYGTQLNMNFANGLRFRTCDSNTWSEWVTK